MASSSSTETYTTPPPSSHSQNYVPQYTPPTNSSTTAPLNVTSQTSPHAINTALHQLPMTTRQLRPPKSPLYRPAVLRPTERPWRQGTMSPPPGSSAGSVGSMNSDDGGTLGRVSTGDSAKTWGLGKVAEVEWICDEGSGEVTGLPTRAHWQVSYYPSCHPELAFCSPLSSLVAVVGSSQSALFLSSSPAQRTTGVGSSSYPSVPHPKLPAIPFIPHPCGQASGTFPPLSEKTNFRGWGSCISLITLPQPGGMYIMYLEGFKRDIRRQGPPRYRAGKIARKSNVFPIL